VADVPDVSVQELKLEEEQEEVNGSKQLNGSPEPQNGVEGTDKIKKLGELKSVATNVHENFRTIRGVLNAAKTKNDDLRTEIDTLKSAKEALEKTNEELHAKNEEQASRIQSLETKIGNQDTLFRELLEILLAISGPLKNAEEEMLDIVSEFQRCVEFI
jgi:chromosome segregation ATPase